MEVRTSEEDGFFVMELIGEVDARYALLFDEALMKAEAEGRRVIILDCTKLTFISSTGIGVLAAKVQEWEGQQAFLVLANVSEKFQQLLQILGIKELFTILPSREAAKVWLYGKTKKI